MDANKNKECTVQFEPSGLKAKVRPSTTLLEAAHRAGIYLSSRIYQQTFIDTYSKVAFAKLYDRSVSRQQKWHRLKDLVRREFQAVSWG